MLSLDRCRELLGAECRLSDAELARVRDDLYAVSAVAIELGRARGTTNAAVPQARNAGAGLEGVLVKLSEAERADVIERASIVEFDAGRARDEAERLAVQGLLRGISTVRAPGPRAAGGRP